MITERIVKKLKARLPTNFRLAHRGDHPLLMESPELLVGGEGNLSCVVSDETMKSADRLKAQLTLIRLALPENARVALHTKNEGLWNALSSDFDALIDPLHTEESIYKFIISRSKPKTNIQEIRNSKGRHHSIYSCLLIVSKDRSSSFIEDGSSRRVANDSELLKSHYHLFLSPTELQRKNFRRQVISECYKSITNYVNLDNGTPHITNEDYFRILLSDFLPTQKDDPSKPTRALAFSGRLLTDVRSTSELESLVLRVQDFIKNPSSVGEQP